MAHNRVTNRQTNHLANRRNGWLLATVAALGLAAGLGTSALAAGKPAPPAQDLAATATQSALKQRALQATLTAQAQPATPTKTPTPLPTHTPTATQTRPPAPTQTPTLRPTLAPTRTLPPPTRASVPQSDSPVAQSLVRGLNIRSGPGTTYPVIGNASSGQSFPVTGQFAGCAWLQISLEDGGNGWISGAPAYSTLNVPCSTLRAAAPAQAAAPPARVQPTSTPTPRPAQVSSAAPTPMPATVSTPAPAGPAAAGPGVITSFEPLGNWQRGDEAYGTLRQSSAQAYSGAAAGELTYDFPAEAGSGNYVVFLPRPPLRITSGAAGLELQVYGDGSGNFLNAWIADSGGLTWQLTFGRIFHTGWAPMSLALTPSRDWPNGPIGEVTADQLTEPLSLRALVLDGAADGAASSGVIYLDTLSSY